MAETGPPWRVLVADDEPAARLGVRQLLRPYPEFVVAGECRNGREVLAALEQGRVDALFLDIQMPEIGGFEVIREHAPEVMPALVFLTAYDQFAVDAFEVQALDYLVKPVGEKRFATTLERLRRHLARQDRRLRTTLAASTAQGTVVLDVDDIEWVESADNYVRVWAGGRGTLVRRPMSKIERLLDGRGFQRAHRQAIVRLDAVRRLETRPDGEVTAHLASGAEVRISRRRRAAFAAAVRGQER